MIIVIPVGPSDASNLHLLTQAITRLGVVEAPILIVSVPSLQQEAEAAAATLNATVSFTEDEFAHGWPVGPDRMFIWTVRHLAEIGNDQPWLWLEPDACPIKPGWDVLLSNAYVEAKKPYFGFTRPTAWRDAEGNLTPIEGDNMLLGVAIYPPNMLQDKDLLPLLNDLNLPGSSHPPVPWDIYLRWHFFRKGVHSSNVIFDRWRTCNYTRGEFDEILCEPIAGERGAVGGTIPDEAVLVHGCKDGSLHRLIIGSGPGDEPSLGVTTEEEAELIRKEVMGKIADEILLQEFKGGNKPVLETAENVITKFFGNNQLVSDALEKLDQPRISSLVTLTKLDKETIKQILPSLGYEVLHAGWVRKKN